MIPAQSVSPNAVNSLVSYLTMELRRAEADRKPLEAVWMKYHDAYRAHQSDDPNNFPLAHSANLTIPVIATDVDTIYARLMSMYFGSDNLWVCTPLNDQMVDFAPRLEEFLAWAQDHELRIYDPVADWLLETAKLGTGVLKTRYTREMKKVYEFREIQSPDGSVSTMERQARILLKDHPEVSHVSLWNFYVPAGWSDLQAAPWCAERISLTWPQLLQRARAGLYTNIDRLGQQWANSRGNKVELNLDRLDSFMPSQGDKFDVHEFWLDWDIDGDGELEAIVCTMHVPTQTILRLDFNPFFNQEKPYDYSRYLRAEKRFYGIGIAEMLYTFQVEISTMHNQRIDNFSIANAMMFKALKTGNIKQDEPFFPGRILLVDSMDEIQPMPLGIPYTVDMQQEQLTLNYASRRTGVNDFVEGNTVGSTNYATATTAVQQLREGSKRIDQTLRENRRCLSQVGMKVAELYQQYNQGGKPYLAMGQQDGEMVMRVLQFPLEIIRAGVGIDVSAASVSHNKDVQLRSNVMILQQVTQYYMQMLQTLQIAINPQVPPQIQELAREAATGGSLLMRRILDESNVQDVDRIVPDIQSILNAGQQQYINPLQAALAGGAPMGQGPYGASGIQAVPGGGGGAQGGIAGLLAAGSGAPQAPSFAGNGTGV